MNGFRLLLCAVGISCLIGCVNLLAFGFLVCAAGKSRLIGCVN